MRLKGKFRRWMWLLLLPILGIIVWRCLQPPEMRLVGQYPYSSVTALSNGFLLWDMANGQEIAIFRDWAGHERWRISKANDGPSLPSTPWAIAPDGHAMITTATTSHGVAVTVWRDGREMRHVEIGTPREHCTWVDVQNNGAAWATTTCAGNTLHLYALQADRVLHGEAPLPRTYPGSTEKVTFEGSELAQVPACVLAPDATTLRVAASVDKMSATAYYPAFLTFRLRMVGTHLELHPVAHDTTTVEEVSEKWYDKSLRVQSSYHIAGASGAPWVIPDKQAGGFYSESDQTPDGRYALVARIKTNTPGTGPMQKLWQFVTRYVPAKSDLTVDLYERPGILRAHAAVPLPQTHNHALEYHAVHLSADGQAALVAEYVPNAFVVKQGSSGDAGENSYLFHR